MQLLITIKVRMRGNHDPRNKVTEVCPVFGPALCTDSNGAHHTGLLNFPSIELALQHFESRGVHVTRIEEVI